MQYICLNPKRMLLIKKIDKICEKVICSRNTLIWMIPALIRKWIKETEKILFRYLPT